MKGLSFDQLYPGTYIKSGEFDGKSPTLTIKAVTREMLSNGSGGEEGAVIVAFAETEKQWVMNKTCAVCLRAMWGDDSGEWAGHRLTLHAVSDASGLSESGLCVRVKGSPELERPLQFRARLGRKMVTQTLIPTGKHIETVDFSDDSEGPVVNAATGEVTDPAPPTTQYGDDGAAAAQVAFAGQSQDSDDEPPGRGPLFAPDDPNRPASARQKAELGDLRIGLTDEQERELMVGVDLGTATMGEVEALIAKAREAAS